MPGIDGCTRRGALALSALALAGCTSPQAPPAAASPPALAWAPAPAADHHQHLFSPAMAALLSVGPLVFKPIGAREMVAFLDEAGIGRALVLSVAYIHGQPTRSTGNEYEMVRAENDWTGSQVAQFPQRLRAFCSFNPLKDYALAELDRCAADAHLRWGVKLHFGNSDVLLQDPAHVARLREVFAAAARHRMAIVVHVRASVTRQRAFGAAEARVFLQELLPAAGDSAVQVAHLAGASPGHADAGVDAALEVLAQAREQRDPRVRNLWVDVAAVADGRITPQNAALVVRRLRQFGLDHVLYGSDAPAAGNLPPKQGWEAFRRLPLTPAEFATVAGNLAPYWR